MDENIRVKLATRLDASPDPPILAVKKFLQSYCSDYDSMEQIRSSIRTMYAINPRTLLAGRAGLEALLSDQSMEPGVLARLVAVEANKGLDDPSDTGARQWLERLLQVFQEELN